MTRSHSVRNRIRLTLAALGLATTLGGCVAYPAYPDYGYGYGNGYSYGDDAYYGDYPPGYVAVGGGWAGWGWGWHDHDWHDHDWHGRGWR